MSIQAEGLEELRRALGATADRARDPREALEAEARALAALVDGAFAGNRSPDGRGWAPRKVVAVGRGRRARPRSDARSGRDLLERTGRLRDSIDARVEGDAIVVEASAPYAAYVHAARPFLPYEADGSPMTRGPAGEFFEAMPGRIAAWIVGEVRR